VTALALNALSMFLRALSWQAALRAALPSVICHNDQCPIPPPDQGLNTMAADSGVGVRTRLSGTPEGLCRGYTRAVVLADRESLLAQVARCRVAC
jgi:hypothetical protein